MGEPKGWGFFNLQNDKKSLLKLSLDGWPGEAPHFTPKRFSAIALPQTYAYKVGAPKSKLEIRVWGFSRS
jgi:hypothetical protein